MLFDSHAHVNFEGFSDDWKETLDYCRKSNIWVTNVGSQMDTSRRAVEIASLYDEGVYASVGLHPTHAHRHPFDGNDLLFLAKTSKKVVAIGECGIDFYHSIEYFREQKEIFISQIRIAKETGLPLIVHGRNDKEQKQNSYQEIIRILKKEQAKNGVIHCFGGTTKEADEFLRLGFYIGFTGIITFPGAKEIQNMAGSVPLDAILIETDCPYLAPQEHRGEKNYPQYVEYVAKKIAEIKGASFESVALATFENARKLYLP